MNEKLNKISEWIKSQGYPLEMYCRNELAKSKFNAVQSLKYEDTETKKIREIDILATKFIYLNNVTFNFSLVIECKLTKDKPWLVFTNEVAKDRSREITQNSFCTQNGISLLNKAPLLQEFSLFKYNEKSIGFNITQCFTNGKDVPYEALMSTQSACEFLVRKSNESGRAFCNFYFPVIVIDAELYKCFTDENNDISIEQINTEKIMTIRSYTNRPYTLHTVVTKDSLATFASDLSAELDTLMERIKDDFLYISEHFPRNFGSTFI